MATAAGESRVYAGTHSDFFLKFGEIKGESQDHKHKGELDILSWSWGVAQAASHSGTGGAGAGKAVFEEFHITKQTDSATPKIMQACASGQHFPEVTLTCRRAGGTQAEYLKIVMSDVIVTSVQLKSESPDPGTTQKFGLPVEALGFRYSKMQILYKAQNPDGTEGANTQAGWDLKQNVKV